MQRHTPHLKWVLLLGLGMLTIPWSGSAQDPVTSRFKLSIGGSIKPEFIYRTNNGGVGFAGAIPGAQNFGFAVVPQHNTTAGDNDQFIAAANESRFQFTINAPDWKGLKTLGYLEMDFEGDTASTIERLGAVAPPTGIGNPAGSINNGGFRIRHAFLRVAGEGFGGSWNVLAGQTWHVFGLIPYHLGSSVSFGGAGILAGRGTQFRFQHTGNVLWDLAWENTINARTDTTNFNEIPGGDASTRFIYRGWQGWQGGSRQALNLGFSATVQRQKADLTASAAVVPGGATLGGRSISATAWGISGVPSCPSCQAAARPIGPGPSACWARPATGRG